MGNGQSRFGIGIWKTRSRISYWRFQRIKSKRKIKIKSGDYGIQRSYLARTDSSSIRELRGGGRVWNMSANETNSGGVGSHAWMCRRYGGAMEIGLVGRVRP